MATSRFVGGGGEGAKGGSIGDLACVLCMYFSKLYIHMHMASTSISYEMIFCQVP